MLRSLKNSEEGFVLIMVSAVVLVVSVLIVTLISLNVSQVLTAEDEVKRLQAEALARGAMEYLAADQISGTGSKSINFSETLGNFTYSVTAQITSAGLPGYTSEGISVTVDY